MATISRVFPRFEGKWVMVTGAGTGFGATLARRAAAEGANVIVHYNSSAGGAEQTAAAVRELGREALIYRADIKQWADIRAMIEAAWSDTGGVDGAHYHTRCFQAAAAGDVQPARSRGIATHRYFT